MTYRSVCGSSSTARMRGRSLGWFTDTYTGASASADAWAAVSEIGSQRRYRTLVMNMLQDEFGGLCSIKAANGAVFDDDSDVTDPWKDGGCEPDAPAVTAAAGAAAGSIQVSWTAPESGGAPLLDYEVHWKLSSATWPEAGFSFPDREAELDATATSYTITGLTAGAEYTVRVRASNSIGDGEWSADAESLSGAPARSDLPPPKNLRAVTGKGSVKLTWEAPDDATVTGYRIERRRADEDRRDNHTLVEDTGSSETGYTDQSAEKGVEYEYRVSARNDDGAGDASDWVSAEPDEEPVASEDVAVWSAIMTVEWVYQGYGYYSTDTKKAGSLSPASFEVDGTTYTVKMVETQGWWTYIGVDRELPFDFVVELDGVRFASNDASFRSYSYGNIYRWEGTGLSLSDGDAVEVRLLRAIEDETAVNSAATGAPIVSGTVQVGETLTADTSGIADEDGLDDAVFGYQWLADNTEVAGATGSTYTLVEADKGKAIKVQVSFTDDGGNEETLTSTATATVEAPPNNPATGAPTISGTAQVGETLTADTSGIADADGLDNAAFTYQWLAGDSDISGATGSTYTLADADEGKAIKVQVSFTDDAGNDETLTSTATDTVSAAPISNTLATGAPTISGTARVGETLTASTLGISDADGLTNATLSYQWLADDADISGATGSTYTLTDSDEGKTVTVRVSFTDDAGNDEVLTSAATDTVSAAPTSNTLATGAPTISGTARVGETLTADTSGIADADGLDNAAFTYQWLGDDADIPGATESTYTLSEAVEGKTVTVRVSFTDDGGNDETLTSAATEAVAGNEETLTSEDVAAWSAIMTVEWVYQGYGYYSTDAKKAGSLSPASFEVDGTTYTVQMVETQGWMYIGTDRELPFGFVLELDGARFASNDASFASYSYGNIYKWERTGLRWRDGDTVEVRLLRAFEDETAVNSAATGAPTISGPVQVGETLTADTSGIADADGLHNATFTYQWLADDADISGATGSTYALTDSNEGKAIRVRVSFTDDEGNDETLTSAETGAVAAATQPNNPATGAPTISGTAQVGETLTADTSGIAEADGLDNATFIYQWRADDSDISGATNATYTLVEADEGKAIRVRVSFTDDEDNDETLTSGATDAVAAATQPNNLATGAPAISGTAQVGETLTADTSDIADADGLDNATFTYQWLADDADISGATGSTYTLAEADAGKAIKVRVSFTDDEGNDETLTSGATDAVAAATQPNNPATGAPAISGTAQVGETLTADTSDIADADGLDNATFTYQWLADDADISGATGSTYTLAEADAGKAIKVRVSFTDDADNEETLTSAATVAVTVPLTASLENTPDSHDGQNVFTFELQFSEKPKLSYRTLRDHAFTVAGGTVEKAERITQGSNIRWRITVRPDGDGQVTITLPVTGDCAAEEAICTGDGRMLSNELVLTVDGPGQ